MEKGVKKQNAKLSKIGSGQVSSVLRFSPTAWAKLHFFSHYGECEIGGFGVSSLDDLLFIDEFVTVRQEVTAVSVSFDDDAVADFFDEQVDLGRKPEQFGRIWLHSHPGESAAPSFVDEETFQRVFGKCDWAVMFILACGGESYARVRFNVGPGGENRLDVQVDYSMPFQGSDYNAWEKEYERNIHPVYSSFLPPVDKASEDDYSKALFGHDDSLFQEESFLGADVVLSYSFCPECGYEWKHHKFHCPFSVEEDQLKTTEDWS